METRAHFLPDKHDDLECIAAAEVAVVLDTLANEDRLRLMWLLSKTEKCVSELQTLLGIKQPTLSQQLGVIRRRGLVICRRDGKRIYYSIADARVLAVLTALQELYCHPPGRETL